MNESLNQSISVVDDFQNTTTAGYVLFFQHIHDLYLPIHGYLSLTICIFGTITNILNIIVLTRKEMESPTNKILTGLAVADMIVMVDYIPFSFHNFIKRNQPLEDQFALPWTIFTLIHAHISVVGHTISTWLTVILAVWRYLSVRFLTRNRSWFSLSTAKWSIVATYILVPLFCIPIYLSFTITENQHEQITLYTVDWSYIAKQHDGLLQNINFWVFSVGTKLVPCILLTYLSSALIRVLMETERRKKRLKESCYTLANSATTDESSLKSKRRERMSIVSIKEGFRKATPTSTSSQNDRTTRMLLGILFLFLVTEFPTGLIVLFSGIFGETFFVNVYRPLGEILDMLALINSAVNFILYCSMSKQFRQTFAKLFFL